jgi:hypothetical protein
MPFWANYRDNFTTNKKAAQSGHFVLLKWRIIIDLWPYEQVDYLPAPFSGPQPLLLLP